MNKIVIFSLMVELILQDIHTSLRRSIPKSSHRYFRRRRQRALLWPRSSRHLSHADSTTRAMRLVRDSGNQTSHLCFSVAREASTLTDAASSRASSDFLHPQQLLHQCLCWTEAESGTERASGSLTGQRGRRAADRSPPGTASASRGSRSGHCACSSTGQDKARRNDAGQGKATQGKWCDAQIWRHTTE